MSHGAKPGQRMPVCAYGAACTRPGCVYRHPSAATAPKASERGASDAPVCAAFVGGRCAFGEQCRNRHPPPDEVARIRDRSARAPCRYGARCLNRDCLFAHPAGKLNLATDVPKGRVFVPGRGLVDATVISSGGAAVTPAAASEDVAAARPLPQEPPVVFPKSRALEMRLAARDGPGAEPAADAPLLHVTIPADVWVHDWRRNPAQYASEPDALERLRAANATSPPGVIDLHFQTTADAPRVLEAALATPPGAPGRVLEWAYYRGGGGPATASREDGPAPPRCVWVVTGAGNHSAPDQPGGRGALFDAVLQHLRATRRAGSFRVGKDRNSGVPGAFLLELEPPP